MTSVQKNLYGFLRGKNLFITLFPKPQFLKIINYSKKKWNLHINYFNKTISLFDICLQKINTDLGINLPKEAKDLCTELYITAERNHRRHNEMERYTMFLDSKNQYCESDYIIPSNLSVQCNPYHINNGFLKNRTRTKN